MEIEEKLEQILELVDNQNLRQAAAELAELDPYARAAVFEELTNEEQINLLRAMEPGIAADILQEVHNMEAARLAKQIDRDLLARIVDEMEPDEAADLIGDLEQRFAAGLLERMEEAGEVTPLLDYPDQTAGGRMTSEYLAFPEDTLVGEVVQALREWEPKQEIIPYIFVIDQDERLLGVTGPLALLRAGHTTPIGALMERDIFSVQVDEDQEAAARLMSHHALAALPVVNRAGQLLGVITFDDAIRTMEDETTEDIYDKSAIGTFGDEEMNRSYIMIKGTLWQVWRIRVPFLLITMIGGLLAGVVIDVYEQTLQVVTALAIFIPIVMDMGGNAGTQSATIFARGYVAGQIIPRHFVRQFLREVGIGLGMGTGLGILVGVVAALWQQSTRLGLVVGISLAATILLATTLGFLVPFVLVKLGLDQAAGANPVITTIKDITGLLIYFSLASLLLGDMF